MKVERKRKAEGISDWNAVEGVANGNGRGGQPSFNFLLARWRLICGCEVGLTGRKEGRKEAIGNEGSPRR